MPADEDQPLTSGPHEMGGDDVAGPAIVDADEIVSTALRVWDDVAVQQDDRDVRGDEQFGDALVDAIFVAGQLEGGEEYAGHLLGDPLLAQLAGLHLDVL